MLVPGDPSPDVDALLAELEEADDALRALYRELAADPDRASEYEPRLKDLHARRLDLAQRVGLASLARRRARAVAAETPQVASEPAAPLAEATATTPTSTPPVLELGDPEGPPSTPATDDQIAEWTTTVRVAGLGSRLNGAPSDSTAWPLILHELMAALGPPRPLDSSLALIEETDALDAVASPDQQTQWARLPRNAQQAWLSMLVARTRALKELPSTGDATQARVKQIIGRYPPWAKAHSPGHVNGMQVKHAPVHGSWAHDARDAWQVLGDLLGEELEPPSSVVPKKKAKRTSTEDLDEPEIEPGWRLLPLVRGRTAILLGGDPREPNRERLERAFHLASLEWPSIEGPRKVEAAVERIRKGAYGLVLVLTPFVFHKQSTPIIEAAKDAGVAWALVEGYGVAAVRHGLERFLGGPRSAVSSPVES
jgi:uncharacterized Zn-binding protein involved in type VI secretion